MNPWYITGCEAELLVLGAVGIASLLRIMALLCRWLALGIEDERLRTRLERDNLAQKYLLEQHRSLMQYRDSLRQRQETLDTPSPFE